MRILPDFFASVAVGLASGVGIEMETGVVAVVGLPTDSGELHPKVMPANAQPRINQRNLAFIFYRHPVDLGMSVLSRRQARDMERQ